MAAHLQENPILNAKYDLKTAKLSQNMVLMGFYYDICGFTSVHWLRKWMANMGNGSSVSYSG